MDETALKKIYNFFQTFIYLFIFLDIYVNTIAYRYEALAIPAKLNSRLYRIRVLTDVHFSHLTVFVLILCVALAAAAKKKIDFDVKKQFWYPMAFGLALFLLSIVALQQSPLTGWPMTALYGLTYVFGALGLHISFANLTKRIRERLKKDVWNTEEESFMQNTVLQESKLVFNVPVQFYYQRKLWDGWMNINPFRGIMVLGVPGSGKSESVIVPFIKQFLAKGFSMLVYDFKYPTLASIVYYHYLLNKQKGQLEGINFHCINLDIIEKSRRVNPLLPQYIDTLAKAGETADAIVSALKKGDKASGSDQFFTQSAINFLTASIYFLAKYKGGKYSSLPHLLAFMAGKYDRIFGHLFSMIELHSLLAPFKSAYDNKAFEQLEGQVGTLRVNISRLATPESFWVFSGNDFDLKISNPKSVVVLANSIDGQNINSAFYAAVLVRTIGLVNTPGNNPCAIVVDETPTLYLHKIENLIATARSNKVAVILGLQELPQFNQQYGKDTATTIASIMGTVISGAVRNRETLDWLEKLFGRIKQNGTGMTIDREKTSVNITERMDAVIPPNKIANQNAGEVVAIVASDNSTGLDSYSSNTFKCKVKLDLDAIEKEKAQYLDLPKYYDFGTEKEKTDFLLENMKKIYKEIVKL